MKILLVLSNGFNEIEAATVVEVLRSGGVDVVTAGIPGAQLTGAHGLTIMAQNRLSDIRLDDFAGVVFPGGTELYVNTLSSSVSIQSLLNGFNNTQRLIAAINNAPMILLKYGLIVEGIKTATHASVERKFPNPRPGPVIADRNFVTGTDTSAAVDFSLKLVEVLAGDVMARRVKDKYGSKLAIKRSF